MLRSADPLPSRFAFASDIDIALEGIEDELRTEAIASDLEELTLPYRFDVKE